MVDVTIPQIGESITTVFIARWIKKPGEAVAVGDAIVELDSDKASMEVPSPSAGVLTETLVEEGDEVDIGSIIARIDETAEVPRAPAPSEEPAAAEDASSVRAGPAARQQARQSGVDLGGVEGTGPRGRVTSGDVRGTATAQAPKSVRAPNAPSSTPGGVERRKMTPLRRTIARRLVEAQHNAAMLTTFNEIDMSRVIALRKRYQEEFKAKHGIKLGFMSFFVKAAIEGLKEFPAVNAEIDGDEIVYKHYFNIGVAVSGPKGLVVPVVRNADRLSFAEVELAIAELGARARDNKLQPDDFKDGTFTLSNGGIFGSLMSTPILNPPQSGILGMHTIQERPVGVDGQIELRPMMYVALSYDHRIIDGREAVSFLVRIKRGVENPERILLEV
ncbi:MAG: 2-oxoglutarate dehydrogenase complex dihydrolipoyllysine-residue succinyltransferase [Myxococcota bacterium]